jgi:ABC-2 type transport system ATP-binding protein
VADNVIELVNLSKKYGSFTAVDQLNLNICKGEIFGLLGPNGAGKSTTILMMLGLTEPTSGSVRVCKINPCTNPTGVKKKVGYLPEDMGFYSNLSGIENLMFTARLNSLSTKEAKQKVELLLDRVGLTDAATRHAGKYSRGMLQRLGLADVLIKNPEVIILDEPTLGIDPTGVSSFLKLIVQLSREDGITVLFSSHDLSRVQEVCDRVGLFVNGKLLAEGDIPSLSQKLFKDNPCIIEVGISTTMNDFSDQKANLYNEEWLQMLIQHLDDSISVTRINDLFRIKSSMDITTSIAKTIIDSGAGLSYLNKKEYGLNDIYNRYFEGVENHG